MTYEDKDTRTVEAIEKIKAILREYDLLAAFTVISQERIHWLYHVDPSWSCLSIEQATGLAKVRAKVTDFATPEQHRKVVELTIGAIACLQNQGAVQFEHFSQLYDICKSNFKVEFNLSDLEYKQ